MREPIRLRGVIEGFYGPPHRHEQRLRTVRVLADLGMNTYLYAPKDDPAHRDRWRDGHLAAEWDRLAELCDTGADLGVAVWFGLSPLHLDPADGADRDRLLAIFDEAVDRGFRHLCLLVDDMSPGDLTDRGEEDLARLHADLVNAWAAHLRGRTDEVDLLFVPLHYHGDPQRPHVRELGRLVDQHVAICWTGPEVCSEHLTSAHTAAISASLRRPVVYWDNHPVNDGPMRRDPHLLALQGREPGLADHAGGLLANLAIEPEASLLAVATVANFCRDPDTYEPEAAWASALDRITGNHDDARAVAELARLSPRSPIRRPTPLPDRVVDATTAVRRAGADELPAVVRSARQLHDDLATTVDRLGRLHNARLARDLQPWTTVLTAHLAGVRRTLDRLERALGVRDTPVDPGGLLDDLGALRAMSPRVADGLLVDLAHACLHAFERVTTPR